jgi:hypothetical protein
MHQSWVVLSSLAALPCAHAHLEAACPLPWWLRHPGVLWLRVGRADDRGVLVMAAAEQFGRQAALTMSLMAASSAGHGWAWPTCAREVRQSV